MNNLKLVAAIALCMAYVAGIATGWAGYTLAGEVPPPPPGKGSWLSHTLQLDADQKERMEAIWSKESLGQEGDDARVKMRALYDARNQEVRALLSPEQVVAFDEIYRAFEEKKEVLSQERRQRRDQAVQETMAILTPEQRENYQKILEDFERRGPSGGHGPGAWPPPGK